MLQPFFMSKKRKDTKTMAKIVNNFICNLFIIFSCMAWVCMAIDLDYSYDAQPMLITYTGIGALLFGAICIVVVARKQHY